MDLSVIIVSYNTVDITRKCLQSVISQTKDIIYEIICVDNGSLDGSIDMIKNEFPSVNLIENNDNLGFAKAQNIGIQKSKGKYLLVLNSDIFFQGNVSKKIVEFLESGEALWGAAGPQILNSDGTLAPSSGHHNQTQNKFMLVLRSINRHFRIKRLFPEKFMRKYLGFIFGKIHYHYLPHNQVKQVDFVDGMCIFLKREVLCEVGLFDEQFFFDYEILDLCRRITSKGWKILFYPEVQVIHLGAASRKTNSPILVETHRSELVYHAKYNPDFIPLLRFITLFVVSLRLFLIKVNLLFMRSDQSKLQALQICKNIKTVVQRFDAKTAAINPKIPVIS